MAYKRVLYEEFVKIEDPYEDAPANGFPLKKTTELHLTHVGYTIESEPIKVWSRLLKEMHKRELSKQHRTWLLTETPATRDFEKYAWAAIRPKRTLSWEIHAQQRGEGYLPPGFSPSFPEPPKHYQRKPGAMFRNKPFHPNNSKRLRILLRMSDALTLHSINEIQDWLLFDLAVDSKDGTPEVAYIINFAVQAVGLENLRSRKIVLHAGSLESNLWRGDAPLSCSCLGISSNRMSSI